MAIVFILIGGLALIIGTGLFLSLLDSSTPVGAPDRRAGPARVPTGGTPTFESFEEGVQSGLIAEDDDEVGFSEPTWSPSPIDESDSHFGAFSGHDWGIGPD